MKVRLSQCYGTVYNGFDYGAVEVYIHAFSMPAPDGDVPLTSTFKRIVPCWKDRRYGVQQEKKDWTRERPIAQLWEPIHVRPDRRLVNIYTELCRIQTKFQMYFSLHSKAEGEAKETDVRYLCQLHIICISGSTDWMQGIYSVVQNVWNSRKLPSIYYTGVSVELSPAVDDSNCGQWSADQSTNDVTSKLLFCNCSSTFFFVSSSGWLLRYAT